MNRKISFFDEGYQIKISFKKKLIRAIVTIISADFNKKISQINFILCSDDYIIEINKQYLNHNYFTDIITFDYEKDKILSDIYISIDRVRDNASQLSQSATQEFYRVAIHGILHLCGLKDKSKKEQKLMQNTENHYLMILNRILTK